MCRTSRVSYRVRLGGREQVWLFCGLGSRLCFGIVREARRNVMLIPHNLDTRVTCSDALRSPNPNVSRCAVKLPHPGGSMRWCYTRFAPPEVRESAQIKHQS